MTDGTINNHAAFIWSVADLLRGDYKQSEYRKVILPLTVLRRLDCVPDETKAKVLATFARMEPAERGATYPTCIAGRRACLPEECGGPWGYADLLEAPADKQHERHEELAEWVGDYFDPDEFDADLATEAMGSSRPFAGW